METDAPQVTKIGLIAGNRDFPLHVARAAKTLGIEVVAIAIEEETSKELAALVPAIHWLRLGQLGKLVEILKQASVAHILLAGQVHPSHITRQLAHLDGEGMKLLAKAATSQGRDILKIFCEYLEGRGFTLLDSATFLRAWVPDAGVLTKRRPTPAEQDAVNYGMRKAAVLAAAGIGQTVVVKQRAVVALEAMEGTDAAIRRAGEIAGQGTVVVKCAEARHDFRFDIPVVGQGTLEAMVAAGATALGVTAGKTLLMDRPLLVAYADEKNLAMVAVPEAPQ